MKVYLRNRKGKLSEKSKKEGKKRKNSFYLMFHDTYTKKRSYEFLRLYLYDKPTTLLEKQHNKETQQLAESIKAQKVLDIQSKKHGFISKVNSKIGFLHYFETITDKKKEVNGTYGNWLSTLKHLKNFCKNKDIPLSKVDDFFLENFKNYLLTEKLSNRGIKLSQNSASSYLNKVKTALKEAYQTKMIIDNPTLRVKGIKEKETHREYLTVEEIKKIITTECDNPLLKDAFLFSVFTGLRFCDIQQLKWKNLTYDEENGWILKYTQQKTKGVEHLPVTEQIMKILGERKNDEYKLFPHLRYSDNNNKKLLKWIKESGIDKHITFHCGRHSFATLQLTMGTDIYTVSKLLGHRHLKTTEIYAKVIDKKKIEAVSKIPELYL